jgi:hypothetical protein
MCFPIQSVGLLSKASGLFVRQPQSVSVEKYLCVPSLLTLYIRIALEHSEYGCHVEAIYNTFEDLSFRFRVPFLNLNAAKVVILNKTNTLARHQAHDRDLA